jgi:hypothetical protein
VHLKTDLEGTIFEDVHVFRVVDGAVEVRELYEHGDVLCVSCKAEYFRAGRGCLLARMAVPHTVGSYIAWREPAEDVFLTVIKSFVAGLSTHQSICYRAAYK